MKGMKPWMWVLVVSGVAFTACIEPMAQTPGEAGGYPVGAQSYTATDLTTTPPPVQTFPEVNMNTLWPTTASARKYVLVVAYTLPPDATGNIPPQRFRAFGLDMSTRSYMFVVDGDSQTYLGAFTGRMISQKAILITTPPGFSFHAVEETTTRTVESSGLSNRVTAMNDGGTTTEPREGSDAGIITVFGTEPVIKVPVGGEGGDDWRRMDYRRLPDIVIGLDLNIFNWQLPGGMTTTPTPVQQR